MGGSAGRVYIGGWVCLSLGNFERCRGLSDPLGGTLCSYTPAAQRRVTLCALISTFLLSSGYAPAFALDDHDPIGITGAFKGVVTTGCA